MARLTAEAMKEIFKFWHPLDNNNISLMSEHSMGIYLIKEDNRIVYVGRSESSVRSRLLQHAKIFKNHSFSLMYVKNSLKTMRYEQRLISHFKKQYPLKNKLEGSIRY